MSKIELIQKAIDNGISYQSKLSETALAVPSFTSVKNRHILNNLGSISERYCEVGLHKLGTFVSVNYDNELWAIGYDDWSEFNNGGETKDIAVANGRANLKNQYEIIDADFFEINKELLPSNIDLYFYDGSHNESSQKRAITHFKEALADEAIIIVDDWDWKTVKDGTRAGLKEAELEVVKEWELTTNRESDNEGFWNGLFIALVKKKK